MTEEASQLVLKGFSLFHHNFLHLKVICDIIYVRSKKFRHISSDLYNNERKIYYEQ